MARPHQPGQATFKAILPEDIAWKPFPAFPPAARLAVVVGDPTQAGPYMIRVKVPGGVKLMPQLRLALLPSPQYRAQETAPGRSSNRCA